MERKDMQENQRKRRRSGTEIRELVRNMLLLTVSAVTASTYCIF